MQESVDKVNEVSLTRLKKLGLDKDDRYISRLNQEVDDLQTWNSHFSKASEILDRMDSCLSPMTSNKSGSLVLFLLGLSSIDPVKEGLDRKIIYLGAAMPDIDCDLDPRYRDDVKSYVVEKYGQNNTCTIGTYVKMLTRTAILDVARVMGIPSAEVFMVTKSLQSYRDDDDSSIEDLDIEVICDNHPQLAEFFELYPQLLPHVKKMRGNKKTMGRHAAGMVVSDRDLVDSIPVCRIKSTDGHQIVSAWSESGDYAELSEVGYIKFDFLGLNHITIIDECLKMIAKTKNKHLTRERIPLNDSKAIETVQTSGLGIFQLESPVTKPVLRSINATSFADIVAAVSLIRPGPKDMGMHLTYGARKAGKEEYEIHPLLQEVLGPTFGIIVFQEQCVSGECFVKTDVGLIRMDDLVHRVQCDENIGVYCVNGEGDVVVRKVINGFEKGNKDTYKVNLDNGLSLRCTEDHRVLTARGWVMVKDLELDDDILTLDDFD